ncbi:hypothetical protein T439DRAFT_329111 [Meredithblackwellia eburnea MCA 4105]
MQHHQHQHQGLTTPGDPYQPYQPQQHHHQPLLHHHQQHQLTYHHASPPPQTTSTSSDTTSPNSAHQRNGSLTTQPQFDPSSTTTTATTSTSSTFSNNFIVPRFTPQPSLTTGFDFAVAEHDSFREPPKPLQLGNFAPPRHYSNYNSSTTNNGYNSSTAQRQHPPQPPPLPSRTSSSSSSTLPYKPNGPIYAPYGSSVVSINSNSDSSSSSTSSPSNSTRQPGSPPTTTSPSTSSFDPVSLGVPAPPQTSTNFAGLYSSSGFDIISVLARVAARPNQTIQIGPVDLSCSFLVVDAKRYDMPIVFASETFSALTGYRNDEIVGRNCRFLQSPDGQTVQGTPRKYTDTHAIWHMRKHITAGKESQSSLINYKKSGEAFINLVTIIPITWDTDEIAYYVGFQVDLVDQPNAILNRMKDGSYTVNYSLLTNPPRSISMLSADPQDSVEPWSTSLEEMTGVVTNGGKLSGSGATVPQDPSVTSNGHAVPQPTVDATTLIDTLAGSGIAGLREEEEKVSFNKLLLENSNDFVHVLSLKGSILYCSPSASKVLEYEPTELVGSLIQGLCHPSDVVPVIRELKDSGAVPHTKVNLLYRIQRKKSGYIWIEASGKLHIEPGKGRKCVILVGRPREVMKMSWEDVRSEGGLADRECWMKLSEEGMVLYSTVGVQGLLGYPAREIQGTSLYHLLDTKAKVDVEAAIKQCRTGSGSSVTHQLQSRRGIVEVVTRFYPRYARTEVDGMQVDYDSTSDSAHSTIIAQMMEVSSRNRKGSTFTNPPEYVPVPGGGNASSASQRDPSPQQSDSPHSSRSGSRTPPFVSTFKVTSHPSSSSDNVFDELDTTRCTSWQYELHQLQILNKRLRDEKEHLMTQAQKRRTSSFAAGLDNQLGGNNNTNMSVTGSSAYDGGRPRSVASDSSRPSSSSVGRVCANCGRTDSPEWRAGPTGLRTLCNACGLRWAKTQKNSPPVPATLAASSSSSSQTHVNQSLQHSQVQTPYETDSTPTFSPYDSHSLDGGDLGGLKW